jgi:glycerol-3-phosphate O-acyltransferase/dihydroxyacetone phosphate acyltransferase
MKDRFLKTLLRFVVFFLYESVEVYTPPDEDQGEYPILAVSNHFGGLADPLLLMYAAPRRPRIMARDKIWKIPIAGSIMNWLDAIQVHKPEEQRGPTSNRDMFRSCYEALGDNKTLLIFPEGITRDDPSIAPVKTGAARIALGARDEGVSGIRILPVGIHYEDKAALRSRVFINAGVPIDLDAVIDTYAPDGDAAPENRDVVRALTTDIELHLRRVAPDFADWSEARSLTQAAEVSLRADTDAPPAEVSIAQRDRLAARLGRAPHDSKRVVIDAADGYQEELDALGLTDREVYEKMGSGRFLWFLIKSAIVLLIAVPVALIGLTVNIWPLIGIRAINLLRVAPAVKATLKPAAGMLLFLIAWGIVLWQAFQKSILLGGVAAVMLPVSLAALIYSSERLLRLWQVARQWVKARRVDELQQRIIDKRAAISDAVEAIESA